MVAVSLAGLHPGFATNVRNMMAESDGLLWVVSAARSLPDQWTLYNAAMATYGSNTVVGHQVAYPNGKGRHNWTPAMAVDFGGTYAVAHLLAPKYRIHFPIPGEPWHAEPMDLKNPYVYHPPEPVQPQRILEDSMRQLDDIIDGITYGDGRRKTLLQRDGGVLNLGTPFLGSIPMVPAEARRTFTEAIGITPINPTDAEAGYIVWNRNGDRYRFDPAYYATLK